MAPETPVRDVPDLKFYSIKDGSTTWGGPALSQKYFMDKMLAGLFKNQNDHPFMFSNTYMSDDIAGNDAWLPAKMLGSGSFGKVGLWNKVNTDGEITDQVVIKQTDFDNGLQYKDQDGLAREAVFLMQMNGFPAGEYTVKLRRYKYFPSTPKRSRFYFEYAPHSDLERLRWRYRFWDRYLPEVFIWDVFDKLARVVQDMVHGNPPWTDFETATELGTDRFLIHFDLKPANVLLGLGTDAHNSQEPLSAYPKIKVADFGQAELMEASNEYDPRKYDLFGTPGFRPPEQLRVGENWRKPPNDYESRPFYNAHNVWCIAKIIYDLVTLSEPEDLLPDNDDQRKPTQTMYYSRNPTTGYDEGGLPTRWSTNGVYSSDLEDLIRKCLNIDLRKRPTPQEVMAATSQGLRDHVQRVLAYRSVQGDPGQAHPDERVYFRGTEINEAAQGNAGIPATDHEIADVNDGRWRDLDQPKLRPPPGTKWDPYRDMVRDDLAWTQPGHQQWHGAGGMIRFVPPNDPPIASVAGSSTAAHHSQAAATAAAPVGPSAGLQGDALRLYHDTHATVGALPPSLYNFMVSRHKTTRTGQTAADWLRKIYDGADWSETGILPGLITRVIHTRTANTTRKQANYALHFRTTKNRNSRVAAAVADLNTMYGG